MPQSNTAQQIDLIGPPRLKLRPWMPPSWRAAVAGREVELRIPPAVRRRCHKPKRMSPSELSVRYRQMPAADTHRGPYRKEFARHAAFVMDTWAKPWVRNLWFCGVDQASKTNTMLSCLFWVIDQAPGNTFYQMSNRDSSDRIMEKKLIPMIKESPRIAQHLSPRADDTTLTSITLTNGMSINAAWAGSTASGAILSARYTFTDEVDKAELIGKAASHIDRIKKRGRTEKFSKHFFGGTPEDKWLYAETMGCVQVWEGTVRCPHCGEQMGMSEEQVIIPDGATRESIKEDPSCIEYACDKCGELLSETDRELAYENLLHDADGWRCIKGEEAKKPSDVGFLLSGFPLPDVKLAEVADTMLRAKAGDLSAKRTLAHAIKAIDYIEETKEREEDAILRLCDERFAGVVHPETRIMTISIDTQDHGFWYEIRGWKCDELYTSWLVKCGYVPSARFNDFSAVDRLIFADQYFGPCGQKEFKISYGIIDSAGHRTSEVYAWCKQKGIMAAKGAKGRKTHPVTVGHLQYFPNTNKPIPGGLKIYNLDTHYHKDILNNKLSIDASDDGAWVLHSGYTEMQKKLMQRDPDVKIANGLEDYAAQFCVEYRDEKQLWQCPNGKANHLFDCAQQNIALAYYLEFHKMGKEEQQQNTSQHHDHNEPGSGLPGWFQNRGGMR